MLGLKIYRTGCVCKTCGIEARVSSLDLNDPRSNQLLELLKFFVGHSRRHRQAEFSFVKCTPQTKEMVDGAVAMWRDFEDGHLKDDGPFTTEFMAKLKERWDREHSGSTT